MRWVLGLLLLGLLGVIACGDSEEGVDDETQATPSAPRATTAAPSPLSPTPVATSTVAPTIPADWATFTDPVLGFTIRYPGDLVSADLAGTSPVSFDRTFIFRPPDDTGHGWFGSSRGFLVSIVPMDSADTDLKTWARVNAACRPESIVSIEIDKLPGLVCTREVLDQHPNEAALLRVQDEVILVTNAGLSEDEFADVVQNLVVE